MAKHLLAALLISLLASLAPAHAQVVWIEAEQFDVTGGWSNDSQHVDLMGSPYLLATGVGRAGEDAITNVQIDKPGDYRLWVRCRDWLPSHSPGQFQVIVGEKMSAVTFGKTQSDAWQWIDGGSFTLPAGKTKLRLHDLTGWWGRCDAVVLARDPFKPANNLKELAQQRVKYCGVTPDIKPMTGYDVVVIGGGPAGIGAALAAARNGCKVAFIQDRPVLGGNSSSEISVPPMGYIGSPPDRVNVSGIAKEIFPKQGWHNFADSQKMERIVRAEENIELFLNTRANGVEMLDKQRIKSVLALDVHTGQRMAFAAPRFIDCTGHGWIGYYAGAEYRMGEEARDEFGETLAPIKATKRTQGNTLYKAVFKDHRRDGPGDGVPFECPAWAYQWKKPSDFETAGHRRIREIRRPENYDVPSRGKGRNPGNDINGALVEKWWVEYGGMLSTIDDAERIRDELFRINIGLWNYAKNHNPATVARNRNRELVWLNYVPGVRESRRLVGDYMMRQEDYDKQTVHADTVAFTDWGPDVHHPEGYWVHGNDCIHVYQGRRTSIPYRTLYSKNIENLFMAGRCHSATHIAHGGTRVMRSMCATGQAAGTAAAIAHEQKTTPRGVYESHVVELQQTLLKDGCYLMGVKNADPADLALGAVATASSEAPGASAGNVNNGWNRVVGESRNAWAPEKGATGPQWVQLQLPKPAEVDTIHVTFEDELSSAMVQLFDGGEWRPIACIMSNSPARRGVYRFSPVKIEKLRVLFEKPSKLAAICEVRVYREGEASGSPGS